MKKTIKAHAAPAQTKAVSLRDAIFDEMIPHLTKTSSEEQPISTGYERLDRCMNGFRPGELTIVGARPAMGKTSFVLGLALNVAKTNKKALFISEDMSSVQLCARAISIEGKIEDQKIMRTGQLSAEERHHLSEVVEEICDYPLCFVSNTEFYRTFSVKKAADLAHEMKADIVFFDFLPDDANQLKQMATMLNVPVVATCQLKRSADSRGPCTRPKATDLRAPDTVLMDADVILLLYRKDYYDENVVPVEIIVAKSNYGAVGTVDFLFHSDYVYFSESNEISRGNARKEYNMEDKYNRISKEDICEEALRLVAETFDSFGIWFFVTNFEGHEVLTVPLCIANAPTLEMQFVVDENPNSVLSCSILKARVYGLYYDVPYGPLMKIYNILNNWNGKSIFMSFHMDSDREIYMKYDFPASCSKSEDLGRMALEVLSDTKQFLMENYCDLLNILKTDEDGEFVPHHKWEEDNAFLKRTCRNDYPLTGNMLVIRLEEIYGSMEYQCWVPFEEKS